MKNLFKSVSFTFLLFFIVLNINGNVYAFSGAGNGTSASPYLISTPQQLSEINNNLSAHYKLQNDIDLNNENFEPIGSSTSYFTGKLDGNGYKIINLNNSKGLFISVRKATLLNITIENVTVKGSGYIGALAGTMFGGTIENCTVYGEGIIEGSTSVVGGLIGRFNDGTVVNCSSDIEVIGKSSDVGGLMGTVASATIEKCYSNGNVTGNKNVGGLVGSVEKTTIGVNLYESYSTGDVKPISSISSDKSTMAGLIGYIPDYTPVSVENCFSLGDNVSYGLIGYLGGSNSKVYVTNCYSINNMVSRRDFIVTNSYYDGTASQKKPSSSDDYSRLTISMKRQSNYEGWDFTNIWTMEENISYPYLKNLKKPLDINKNDIENIMSGGIGTENDPYLISTVEQLNNIAYEIESHYKLVNDIDLNDREFKSIGDAGAPFSGTLDGAGYVIRNFKRTGVMVTGLFEHTKNAHIKNIIMENVIISRGRGISAVDERAVSVVSNPDTGTLIGAMQGGIVENCSILSGEIISNENYNTGGIVGRSVDGTIINSNSHINITSKLRDTGGIVGYTEGVKIENCYTTGDIKGSSYTGGLVGRAGKNTFISNSYTTGEVVGTHDYTGGLIGYAVESTIEKCYALGNVTGTNYIGGLIGYVRPSGLISESYATGNVTSSSTKEYGLGGLIGYASVSSADAKTKSIKIENCFSLGNVTMGGSRTGGLIGDISNYTQINNCYSAGNTVGAGGGLTSQGTPEVTNSYFNSEKSLHTTPESQARTTEELMQRETFVSWDFDNIWNIYEGTSYPFIRNIESPFESLLEPPATISYKELSTNSVVIQWSEVSDATEYEVNYLGKSITTPYLDIKIEGLLAGKEYKFKVRGKNKDGYGKWSDILTINTEALPLEKVVRVICVEKTNETVTLGWNTVHGATSYEVIYDEIVLTSEITSITVEGLKVNNTYTFQVRGVNSESKGPLSDPITVITVTYNPQTAYAKEFLEKCEEQVWFIDAVEQILNNQGKSVNTIESKEDFTNVFALGLSNRNITGTIPKAIGELYNLEYLYLCKNKLRGGIPSELYSLNKLKNLDLSENELSGRILENISRLSELEVLLLHRNEFDGTIPSGIFSLRKLKNLDLAQNNLSGTIPSGIINLTNLKFLSLSDNKLTGTLPNEISSLANLEVLILSDNLISGNVLSIFNEINNLKIVDLSNSYYEKDDIDEIFLEYLEEDKLTGVTVIIK